MFRVLPALCLCLALSACVHDSPDGRLDSDQGIDSRELAAMLKLDCSQRREEVQLARDDTQSDSDRAANYRLAVKAFSGAAQRIEGAFAKEPDLLYLAEGDTLRLRLQRCQAQAVTFTDELRKFELSVEFKPAQAEPKTEVSSAPAAAAPVKEGKHLKAAKKTKKPKTAVAKRKRVGRPRAVLADASREN